METLNLPVTTMSHGIRAQLMLALFFHSCVYLTWSENTQTWINSDQLFWNRKLKVADLRAQSLFLKSNLVEDASWNMAQEY